MKRFLRAAVAALATISLLLPAAAVAIAAPETVIPDARATQPSLKVDADGHRHIAWGLQGDAPGIFVGTDATGSWVGARISTGPDYEPSLALDAAGKHHVLYARDGNGLYLATDATGSWVTTQVRSDPEIEAGVLAVDSSGAYHVAFVTDARTPGVYYLTNASGSWVTTMIAASPWVHAPSIAVDAAKHVHLVYDSKDPASYGIHYATNATAFPAWTDTRVTAGPAADYGPVIALGTDGVHIAGARWTNAGSSVVLVSVVGGIVTATDIGAPDPTPYDIGWPSIAWDATHGPRVGVRFYSDSDASNRVFTWDDGWTALDVPAGADDDLVSFATDAAGALAIALRRWEPAPGVYVRGPGVGPELLAAGSSRADDPTVTVSGTDVRIAYDLRATDSTDGIGLATRSGDTWAQERLLSGHGAVDAADGYVAGAGQTGYTSGGVWSWQAYEYAAEDASLAVGDLGPQELYVGDESTAGVGVRWRNMGGEVQLTTDPGDSDVEIAISTAVPSAHLFFVRDERIWYAFSGGALGTPVQVTTVAGDSPSAVGLPGIDENVAMAYRRYGSAPGIYLAYRGQTDGSRISRSEADGPPSIALDPAGKLHIVWARASWGSSPGVYAATNATGAWVVTRLTSDPDAYGATVAITAGGELRIAYKTHAGVRYLTQAFGTAGWSAPSPATWTGSAMWADQEPGGVGSPTASGGLGGGPAGGPTDAPGTPASEGRGADRTGSSAVAAP